MRLLRPLVLLLLLLLTVVRPLLLLPAHARSSSRNVRVVRMTNVRTHRARYHPWMVVHHYHHLM